MIADLQWNQSCRCTSSMAHDRYVVLERHPLAGFGFSIIGGVDTHLPPMVCALVHNGSAILSGKVSLTRPVEKKKYCTLCCLLPRADFFLLSESPSCNSELFYEGRWFHVYNSSRSLAVVSWSHVRRYMYFAIFTLVASSVNKPFLDIFYWQTIALCWLSLATSRQNPDERQTIRFTMNFLVSLIFQL